MTTLTFSNEEINDIMKIVRNHEDAALLIKNASETVENEVKKAKKRISWYVATSGAVFLEYMLKSKGTI